MTDAKEIAQRAIAAGLIKPGKALESKPPMPRTKLTPFQLRELLAMRRAGEPLQAIGRHFGIHHYTVGAICDHHGVKPPKRCRGANNSSTVRAGNITISR